MDAGLVLFTTNSLFPKRKNNQNTNRNDKLDVLRQIMICIFYEHILNIKGKISIYH